MHYSFEDDIGIDSTSGVLLSGMTNRILHVVWDAKCLHHAGQEDGS